MFIRKKSTPSFENNVDGGGFVLDSLLVNLIRTSILGLGRGVGAYHVPVILERILALLGCASADWGVRSL